MIDVIKMYICGVIETPDKKCPHFKACLKNGKKGKCLLNKKEKQNNKRRISAYIKRRLVK